MEHCINQCINWSDNWLFSKNNENWEIVSLPHTCNTTDGMSTKLFRGITCYQKQFRLSKDQLNKAFTLLFCGVGQKSQIYLNGNLLKVYEGGYTPFFVPLPDLLYPELNRITVYCSNEPDPDLIPVSADFNFNNGLHENVYLYETSTLSFDIQTYGRDRLHVDILEISDEKAVISLRSSIHSASPSPGNCHILYTIKADHEVVSEGNTVLSFQPGLTAYSQEITLSKPHLWNGLSDPFLYEVTMKLYDDTALIDMVKTRIGLRCFSMDHEKGFLLNGRPYPLRGVGMHQDAPEVMSAMRPADFDRDYSMIKDLGCTFLRLAHYPHDEYAFSKCDELGLIVQTEIPWINHIGPNAGRKYYDCIRTNLQSMITNYYNHCSIVFWGICNELNGSHWKEGAEPQGGFSSALGIQWVNEMYAFAKKLDSYRYIGFTSHDDTFTDSNVTDWKADFIASNQYKGWYGGDFSDFGFRMDTYLHTDSEQFWAVGEYGAGNNPFQHSLQPFDTTETGTGGARHDEEYANLFHESYLAQIIDRPWLVYTSVWILFDFAVASRNEGETPYINDKGLITRDRRIKKDVFYLYQAAWSKSPVVHITGKRFLQKEPSDSLKVYSNAQMLQLYEGNQLLQTLFAPLSAGVVWEFSGFSLSEHADTLRVVGTFDEQTIAEDSIPLQNVSKSPL